MGGERGEKEWTEEKNTQEDSTSFTPTFSVSGTIGGAEETASAPEAEDRRHELMGRGRGGRRWNSQNFVVDLPTTEI